MIYVGSVLFIFIVHICHFVKLLKVWSLVKHWMWHNHCSYGVMWVDLADSSSHKLMKEHFWASSNIANNSNNANLVMIKAFNQPPNNNHRTDFTALKFLENFRWWSSDIHLATTSSTCNLPICPLKCLSWVEGFRCLGQHHGLVLCSWILWIMLVQVIYHQSCNCLQ